MATDRHFVLVLNAPPRAMPRPRGKPGQRPYQPTGFQEWREAAAWELKAKWKKVGKGKTLKGPVFLHAFLHRDGITIWLDQLDESRRGALRGDVDNYAKSIMDVIVDAGILDDDSQVEALIVGFHTDDDIYEPHE